MANIRADEILPSPHAGRWQQSLWAYHLIASGPQVVDEGLSRPEQIFDTKIAEAIVATNAP